MAMTSTQSVPPSPRELSSYIGGAWHPGASTAADTNPADPGDHVASVSLADATTAAEGVRAARAAFAAWRAMGAAPRGEILRRAADLLDERAREIGRDLTREEGKTLTESVRETRLAASICRYFAGQALEPDGETYPSHQAGLLLFTRHRPVGVVSVITPWNFPIVIAAWKIAPALAFGNTVVWKPAETVPLTAVHLLTAFTDAGLPDGALNLVLGKGSQVGDTLTGHDEIDAVTFTGSNAVGRGIQARAAAKGKPVQLELGGKNPAIVLADADLALAAEQVSLSAFSGTGQKCTATSRIIVERPVLAEFVDRLTKQAEAWRIGDPLDPATTLGPLSSDAQLRAVTGHLERAVRDGAKAVTGGGRPEGAAGCFVQPTIFVDVDPSDAVAREEIFGPVTAILPADSYQEAVALANDTPYGLSASLFTSDLAKAMRFADDSQTGIVKVNQGTSGVEYHVPFGGMKESGFGHREQGKAAREFFTESKTIYINPG
jgi:acyl-CoA reductase-like NAD-dependent aldehyde dehydrogenase